METRGLSATSAAASRRDVVIATADGYRLEGRVFEPEEARASVVIMPATATPQSYYSAFATYLAGAGIRVITFDYRGIGASRRGSLRGFETSMSTWAERDAVAAFEYVKAQYPRERVVVLGHSFGGQSLGLAPELHAADAAILVGSQLGWFGHWPLLSRPKLAFVWHVAVPLLGRTLGYLPGWAGLSVDLPKGAALEWAAWCRHPEYLLGHVEEARARFSAFEAPTMFWSFTDDEFAPEGATNALLEALSSARIHHYRVAPEDVGVSRIGHFGFFRRGFEASLWPSARDFVLGVAEGREPRRDATLGAAWRRATSARFEEADVIGDLPGAARMLWGD